MVAWGGNQTLAASLKLDRIQRKNKRTHLTPTGLLMEGHYTCNPTVTSELGILRQHG